MTKVKVKNILEKPLQQHAKKDEQDTARPTGYYRDGYCDSPPEDEENHSVAGFVTDEFLDFSAKSGNDLRKQVGLKGGQKWCLCVNRWKEAFDAASGNTSDKRVPKIRLDATNIRALDVVAFKDLKKFAIAEGEAANSSDVAQDVSQRSGKMVKESDSIGGDVPGKRGSPHEGVVVPGGTRT